MAVTPSGKDKLLRHVRFIIGAYDLSGDFRSFDRLENTFEPADMTGVSEGCKNYSIGSVRQVGISGIQALLNDAATGAWSLLKDSNTEQEISVLMGGGGAPAIGDPAYLLPGVQMSSDTAVDTNVVVMNTNFLFTPSGANAVVSNPIGVVLHPSTSLSSTTNGSSVDNGASSSGGCWALLHIVATDGGTWTFKVQDSPNDSDWADVLTFVANGSTLTSEQYNATGTVDRYLRFQATRTSGTVTPICTVARFY